MKRDHRGFSMVEIIVVIAIVGILAGISVTMFGQVRYANAKKTVETVSDRLDSQRITAMGQKETQYLYIYRLDDGYYMKLLEDDGSGTMVLNTLDTSLLNESGTKICNTSLKIYIDSETSENLVSGDKIIRIAFKRTGVFDTSDKGTNVHKILFVGNSTQTITLIEQTGKHYVN